MTIVQYKRREREEEGEGEWSGVELLPLSAKSPSRALPPASSNVVV